VDPQCGGGCRPAIVYHYAFAMLIGVAGLITWFISAWEAQ